MKNRKNMKVCLVAVAFCFSASAGAAQNIESNSALNAVVELFARCSAFSETMVALSPDPSSPNIVTMNENAKFFKYAAIVGAAAYFPNESLEYASENASARINLNLVTFATGSVNPRELMQECNNWSDNADVRSVFFSTAFGEARARVDASEFAID